MNRLVEELKAENAELRESNRRLDYRVKSWRYWAIVMLVLTSVNVGVAIAEMVEESENLTPVCSEEFGGER